MTASVPPLSCMHRRDALTPAQRDAMFALLDQHFEGISRVQFERDLAEKHWVVEVRNGAQLVGFTTLRVGMSTDGDSTITVIYSGDTIMAPEAWGTPRLARNWIAAVNWIRSQAPHRPCYWLLLTSGFRTYRFLPVFWREFYPQVGVRTPPASNWLLEQLAREAYGTRFDPAKGIVRFAEPQRLRPQLAAIPPGRMENPHVAFFCARNPGHAQGDELVCLTHLCDENLTAAGRRMAGLPRE